MKRCRVGILSALLPALCHGQVLVHEEPYSVVPAGFEYTVEQLTSEQCPEIGSPLSVTRSSQGFLWLGTHSGIARFDGYESKIYLDDPAEPTAALTNQASMMIEDPAGVLWVATPGGLKRLDPGSRRFVHYQNDPDDSSSIPPGAVSAICEDRYGTIWIGTGRGVVARLNRSTAKFTRYALGVLVAIRGRIPPIFSLVEDDSGTLWANAAEAVFTYDRAMDKFVIAEKMVANFRRIGAGPLYSMTADRKNQIWLGTPGQLLCFDTVGNLKKCYKHNPRDTNSIGEGWIRQIEEDAFGSLWMIIRGSGITRLDVESDRLTHYHFRERGRIFAERPSANQISANIWFCTDTERFGRFIVRRIPISRFVTPQIGTLATRPSLFGVWTLDKDRQGRLWAGSWKGDLTCLDSSSVIAYTFARTAFSLRGLGPGSLFQTYQDPWGTVWFVTLSRLQWYDEHRQVVTDVHLPVTPNRIGITRDGQHWLVCQDNMQGRHFLSRWDPHTNSVVPFRQTEADSLRLMEGHVSGMCEDPDGLIWFGTYRGGLYSFERTTGRYRRYLSSPGDSTALKSTVITGLTVDSSGTMWIATQYGLQKRLRGSDRFQHVELSWISQGQPGRELTSNRIRGMSMDRKGRLWFTLLDGSIAQFDPRTETSRSYGVEEGIQLQAGLSILYDREDDLVYVGGQGVLAFFHPDSLRCNMNAPSVVLTSFRVFEKDLPLVRDISVLDTVILAHSDNYFSFSFSALDYTNPARNRYAYRLEGVDRDWVQSGYRRFASYTNLDPGIYVLKVRGSNNNGIWNLTGRLLTIIITPPWWRTAWAYIGYFIIAFGSLYAFWRYDRKRVTLRHSLEMKNYEAEKMREMDEMKSRFFANISHEFRTPLTLILGPINQLAEQFKAQEVQTTLATMRRNGLRLLQLINQLLDLSRIDAGRMSVQVRQVDLVALTRSLVMSFISLTERKKIELIFDPQAEEIIAYVDRDKVEKILTNLLSNAIKFTGEGGEVKVSLRLPGGQDDRRAEITVADTGIGIAPQELDRIFDRFYQVDSAHTREHGGTGIGLALTKELVDLHKGEITVTSTPGKGSTFTVRVPLGKEHWRPEEIIAEDSILSEVTTEVSAAILAEGAPVEPEEAQDDSGRPVVLVVEDNADVRSYLRGLLQGLYRIEEAENGKAGLERASETEIDLVISDIMMPVMDGVQFCRKLKEDDLTNHIPVILLTARASEEIKLEGLDIGADDYIVKPFDPRELVARAKNLIELRRKLREKYQRHIVLGPANVQVASAVERFLEKLKQTIQEHIADADYDTEKFAHDMCMSRMQLNRKLRALTGHPTHELVREFRLQRAAELLRKNAGNVSEVAFEVGFNDLSHFARAFRERFGMLPSEYETGGPEETPGSMMVFRKGTSKG